MKDDKPISQVSKKELKKYNKEKVVIDEQHNLVIKKWFKYFLERERINSMNQGLLLGFSGGLIVSLIISILGKEVSEMYLIIIVLISIGIFSHIYRSLSRNFIKV